MKYVVPCLALMALGIFVVLSALGIFTIGVERYNNEVNNEYECISYECIPIVGFCETYEDTHNSGGISFGLTSNGVVPVIGLGNTVSTTEHKYYTVFTVNDVGYLLTTDKYDLYLLLCNTDSFTVTKKPNYFIGGYGYYYNDYLLNLKELTNDELDTYKKMARESESERENNEN